MRHYIFVFLAFISLTFKSQTLYWVGGSGTFADGNHWSLTSGGAPANLVPSMNSDAIFDDRSGGPFITVKFDGVNNVKTLRTNNISDLILFVGNKSAVVNVTGSFFLNPNSKWDNLGTTNFKALDPVATNSVYFGLYPVNGDLLFNEGTYKIYSISQQQGRKAVFSGGKYFFNKASFYTSELIVEGATTSFVVDTSLFVVNKLSVKEKSSFSSSKFAFYAPVSYKTKYIVPSGMNFGKGVVMNDNALSATCAATIATKPACSGTCSGVFSLTLDPSCASASPPYNVQVTTGNPGDADCANTASLLSSNNIPNTYSVGGACFCPGSLYSVFIYGTDFLGIPVTINGVATSNFNFQPPSFSLFMPASTPPSCFGSCNGSMNLSPSGGTSPYSVTVTPAVVPTFTTVGGFSLSALCAGTYTFVLADANGCVSQPFPRTLNGPTQILTNSVVTHVPCGAAPCTGSITVSPTGGAPGNYTVNFNPGGTFTLAPGGTASVTGLCNNVVVNVTVTGVNNCSVTSSATITQPPNVTITPTQTNVVCAGACTGGASVAVSGGVAPYTYTWSPGPSTLSSISGLCPGGHTVTIGNNGGACSDVVTFNITQSPSITPNASVTNITCAGLCNGSATVNPSGGNGAPYSYTWSPAPGAGQGTGTVSGLCAGSYTVSINDAMGCATLAVVSITAPAAYTVTTITQTIACFGQCTGAASVSVSGNTGPYSFTWTPAPGAGQGTGTISNLCAGNYTATIVDSSPAACPTTAVVFVTQPSSIIANVSSASITCNAACNGSIGANPSGGNGSPYTYTLNTPAGSTITSAPPYNSLCAGVYTLSIADNGSCKQTFTINIQQPNPLVPSVVMTSVTCFNACNGSLAGSVVGGTPGYTVFWNTPTGTVSGAAIGSRCAGNYTFNVTDANGCFTTQAVTLLQPSQITATITPTNPNCSGVCNGVLSASVNGGTPGYTLNWSNGFVGNPNTGLCAGNYTLTVNDANSCIRTFTASLTAPTAITVSQTVTNPVCAGGCNGSATITASGGTPSYTYQSNIPPLVTNTTGIFTGLCPGNYNVSITDANGCSQAAAFTVTNPPVLSVPVTSIVSSCNACTGGATVSPSGGTPGYTVVWTNSLAAVVGTNAGVSSLCAGPYTATATDAAGCSGSAAVSILQTVSVTVFVAGSGIQCYNACTGSAVATATGGTAPYSFTWNPTGPPAQTTQTATNLCPNTYTVQVVDINGCSNTGTITLANPPDISIVSSQTNVVCNGACNGAISTTVSGGTGTLTRVWSPGGQTTASVSGLCAGVYTLTVTDQNNCTKIQTYTITQNPALTATFSATNPSGCAPTANGSICVTPSGGTGGPYSYTWSPVTGSTNCRTNLGAGAYTVIISDGSCTTALAMSLTNPSGPSLTISTSSVTCFGASTGGATVTASGTPTFGFSWPGGVSFTTAPANVSTASGLANGVYNVSVSDGNNCITSQTFNIQQASSITVSSSQTNPSCNAACNGSITINTSGGTPGYTFNWLPAAPPIVGQGSQTVTSLCSGSYTVNITDANSCVRTRTFTLVAPSSLSLSATPSNVKCFGACDGSVVANASGGTPGYSYTWSPGGAITSSVNNLCPGIYTVNATDALGCTGSTTVLITEPTALSNTFSSTNALCSNSCNATASNTVSGGTPTYSYSWSGSPATTPTIANLCPGNYSATVTDANGCTVVTPFTVTAPPPFTGTLTAFSPLCNAACNGSITATLAGEQGTVNYVWSPSGPNSATNTGLCAGNYTLVATDASSCQMNAIATLTNPPAMLANVTTTNPLCFGDCNGLATSNPTNNVGVVGYTWTPTGPPTQTTQTATGLCAGNYTVFIEDQLGCRDSVAFAINNPGTLSINPAVSPATCGSPNGSITVVVSGGTPAYTYTWLPPGPSGSVATGLAAGVYTVEIADINNCTHSVSIPLSNADGPSVTPVSSTSISCNGACTGGATINIGGISGGTPGYVVSWLSPPAPGTVNPLSGLCAGTYSAQVTDANACVFYTAVTIAEPPAVLVNSSFTLPTCNGICDGIIELNTSGGTPGYSYNWTPLGPNNSATLSNACAGNYTVQITDQNLCVHTETINLPAIQNMAATFTTSANPCFNSCLGAATISPSGGAPTMSVSWSNGQVGYEANNLCVGVYTAIVTDANSCFDVFTTTITAPPPIVATSTVGSPACNMCDGTASVTAFGGTPAYTYSWSSGANGPVANNLCAGLYQVLITDNFSCSVTQNVLVSNNAGISGETFTVQDVICAGNCTGGATVTPIGGAPVITYSWIAPSSTLNAVNNLCPGDYFVQMTDGNGCIRTASTSIVALNSSITISPFVTEPDCGLNNGSIRIIPSGGSPGYTISWGPPLAPNSSSVVSGLGAGVYSVTVTDASGCTQTEAFALSNSFAPVITFTQTNIACFNDCTGSIEVAATSTSPTSYSWSNGSTSPTVTSLCSGVITLTVNEGGCIAIRNFTLIENSEIKLSLSNVVHPNCNDDCNGVITLVPSGGTLPYTYNWSPGTTTVNPNTGLCAGPGLSTTYASTVTDVYGCSVTETVNLINPALLVVTNTLNNSSCTSAPDGSATLSLSGGTPTYNISWLGPNSFTANTQSINNVLAGTYTALVTDSRSCTATNIIQIVPTITIVANAGRDSIICATNSIVLNGNNSIGASNFNWFVVPLPSATLASTSTLNVVPAVGTTSYVLEAISSVSTCVDTDMVVITVNPLPVVSAGLSYTIPMFSNVVIGGTPTASGNGPFTYSWSPSFALDNAGNPNPLASNTLNTTYTITVIDAFGCMGSDTMRVILYPEIKIPNGFSPNGDGKNDKWIIDYIDQFPDCVVEVYNRWGERLFNQKGYTTPFDGRFNGKDLPVGTYYYIIVLNHPAYPNAYTGPLTIFR